MTIEIRGFSSAVWCSGPSTALPCGRKTSHAPSLPWNSVLNKIDFCVEVVISGVHCWRRLSTSAVFLSLIACRCWLPWQKTCHSLNAEPKIHVLGTQCIWKPRMISAGLIIQWIFSFCRRCRRVCARSYLWRGSLVEVLSTEMVVKPPRPVFVPLLHLAGLLNIAPGSSGAPLCCAKKGRVEGRMPRLNKSEGA